MLARAIECTENKKLGPMSATYASQRSCPVSCPLMDNGCYAQYGPMGIHTARLNNASETATPREVAIAEAEAIHTLSGRRDLRLHVVGDCATSAAADIVSQAVLDTIRKGIVAFGYTHAWRDVDRRAWNGLSVLASCDTLAMVREARDRGWATAVITGPHPTDKLYEKDGLKTLPCPQQTHKGVTCSECRLCMKAEHLKKKGITIGFAAHGARTRHVLEVIQSL